MPTPTRSWVQVNSGGGGSEGVRGVRGKLAIGKSPRFSYGQRGEQTQLVLSPKTDEAGDEFLASAQHFKQARLLNWRRHGPRYFGIWHV